jgi:hypothetical protein
MPRRKQAKADSGLTGNEAILKRCRDRRTEGFSAWSDQMQRFDVCMRMADGDQWEQEMVVARGESRPRVVVNLLEQHIQQVVNQQRQNRPGGKVSPVDNEADPDVAEVIEGLIRHIEYASNAFLAYDTAVQYCITGALGYFGIDIDFAGPDTLDQEIRVIRCADPKLWMIDPNSVDQDGGDAKWFIELKRLSRDEFEELYPDAESSRTDFVLPSDYDDWLDKDGVWLANYWELRTKKRKLARVSSEGQSQDVFIDELDPEDAEIIEQEAGRNLRQVDYPYITCYLTNGYEILDETPWPGTRIPRYPVYGNERYVQGQRKLKSLISDALEPQRMLNYHESLNVEAIALAPTPKWLMPEGADEGHEVDWTNPNKARNKVLHWRQTSWGETIPPVWQVFEPKSQAMDMGSVRAQDYIERTTGQFESALGNTDPKATSGKAIQALQSQSANATSHFSAALIPGLTRLYRDVIQVAPIVYQEGQMIQIIGPDQAKKVVQVGQQIGQKKIDFKTGRYDVTVSVGPSQQSQRQEATDFAETLLQSPVGQNPQIAPKLTAKIVKLRELGPIGDDIQELLDPQPKQGDPQQLAQQMQQLQQVNQQLTDELHRVSQFIETKQIEQQGQIQLEDKKFEHQAILKEMDNKVQLILGEAKISASYGLADIQRQLALIQQGMKQAHDLGMAAAQHAQSREAQDVQHQQGLEQQQQAADLAPNPSAGASE